MWVCIVGESEDEGVSLQCQVEVRVGCVSAVSGGSEDEGVCLQRQVEVRVGCVFSVSGGSEDGGSARHMESSSECWG